MIKIKSIIEITGVLARAELKPEFEKMSLRELRKDILNHVPEFEYNIQGVVGRQNKVRIKKVVVTEE
jgi:hypothetical protein